MITYLGWSSSGLNSGTFTLIVYFNHLPEGFTTSAKLFADDMSLFSVDHDFLLGLPVEDDI